MTEFQYSLLVGIIRENFREIPTYSVDLIHKNNGLKFSYFLFGLNFKRKFYKNCKKEINNKEKDF